MANKKRGLSPLFLWAKTFQVFVKHIKKPTAFTQSVDSLVSGLVSSFAQSPKIRRWI
jgi:hypothetical protein